jgi:hypothetical protein
MISKGNRTQTPLCFWCSLTTIYPELSWMNICVSSGRRPYVWALSSFAKSGTFPMRNCKTWSAYRSECLPAASLTLHCLTKGAVGKCWTCHENLDGQLNCVFSGWKGFSWPGTSFPTPCILVFDWIMFEVLLKCFSPKVKKSNCHSLWGRTPETDTGERLERCCHGMLFTQMPGSRWFGTPEQFLQSA